MGFVANLFGGGAARHAANVANVRQQQLAAQQRALGQQQYNAILGMGNQNYNAILGTGNQNYNTLVNYGNNALSTLQSQGQNAYNQLTGLIPSVTSNFQPMIAAGQAAAQAYQQDLPYLTAQFAPTQAQLAATPGYQFDLAQGTQAAQNAAAARGLGVSGNALQAAANYATGLAQNTYAQDAGIFQNGQQIAGNNLINGINAGRSAANASGTLASGLMNDAVGAQQAYNTGAISAQNNYINNATSLLQNAQNNASSLLQGAQSTASADLINSNNSAAASSSTGYQDAASGQIAYNNALASGLNVLANGINQGVGYLTSKPPQQATTTPISTSTASLTPTNSTVSLGSNLLQPSAPAPTAYGSASNLYGPQSLAFQVG